MNRSLSIYLDALRFLAALTVMAAHMTFPQYTGGVVAYQGSWAGVAVAAFFVLSGYVIRYVSVEKERTLSDYAVSRLARIYSVALPALALTMVLDGVTVLMQWPKELPVYQYTQFWKYLPIFLTFTSELGPLRENVLTNGVFWSLSYEVWYYILFAMAVYYGGVKRAALVGVILIVMGPRILLYLPLWLTGVGLFELHSRVTVERRPARILFIGSIALLATVRFLTIDEILDRSVNEALGGWPAAHLRNSQHFCIDYIAAALIALNIFSARYTLFTLLERRSFAAPITYLASFTFSLYLFHTPLMSFYRFVLNHDPHSAVSVTMLTLAVLGSVWCLGLATEHRKSLWRRLFQSLIRSVRSELRQRTPTIYNLVSPGVTIPASSLSSDERAGSYRGDLAR